MTIPADAKVTPLPRAEGMAPFVNPDDGTLTSHGLQMLDAIRNYVVGMNRITPCSASGTNTITLTPNDSAPLHTKYVDHEVFAFVAANNSTGSVTALVEATRGDLPTVKVYITGGAAQAGAGDIAGGRLYLAVYNSLLDGGSGGLVLK